MEKQIMKKLFLVLALFICISFVKCQSIDIYAKNLAKGVTEQQIVDAAMKLINNKSFTYRNVGTCTGFVTRVLNMCGITAVCGDYSTVPGFNVALDQPWSGSGAKRAPDGMYNAAIGSDSDRCEYVWDGKKRDAVKNFSLFKTGDIVITRIQDKEINSGTGHVALMYVDGNHLKMFEAVTAGPQVTDLGVGTINLDLSTPISGIEPLGWSDNGDRIWVYRLIEWVENGNLVVEKKDS